MQHRITSSICLQINSHGPCSKDMMNSINGITRFPLSSWTIHVEQSTTGCLWPTKQDRRQPFNTREVSTSRQNTIHHQASQNHLGTDMSDTVRINYINNISQLLYIDMYVFKKNTIYIQNAYRVIWPTEGRLLSMQKKWRAILGGWTAPTSFHPKIYNFFPVHLIIAVHNHPSNIKFLFFLGGRGGFVQSNSRIRKDFAEEQHQNARQSWSSSCQSGKMVLLQLERCQNQRLKSEDSAIQWVILKRPGRHMTWEDQMM